MADLENFDANEVEPNQDFDAIPADRYECVMTESKWVPNSSGVGKHLKLTWMIVSGPHAKRNLFDRLNLDNPSEKAVQIAKGTLSRICRALKIMIVKDSTQLHNLPIIVRVDREEYEPGKWSNPVKGYYPKEVNGTAQKVESAKKEEKPKTAPWAGTKK